MFLSPSAELSGPYRRRLLVPGRLKPAGREGEKAASAVLGVKGSSAEPSGFPAQGPAPGPVAAQAAGR